MGCQQSTAVPVPPPPHDRSTNYLEAIGWVSFRSAFEPSKVLKYDFNSVPHLRLVEEEDSAECRFRYTKLADRKGYAIELEMEPAMVWYVNDNGQVDIESKSLIPPDRMAWDHAGGYLSCGHAFRLVVPHPSPQFWLPYPFDVAVNTDGSLSTTHTEVEATVFETVVIVRDDDGKLVHLDPHRKTPFEGIKAALVRGELERAAREQREPQPLLCIKPLAVTGPNPVDYSKKARQGDDASSPEAAAATTADFSFEAEAIARLDAM